MPKNQKKKVNKRLQNNKTKMVNKEYKEKKKLKKQKTSQMKTEKNRKKKNSMKLLMNLKSPFLQDHWKAESINLSIQFHMFPSTSQDEDFSKSTNLLLQQSWLSEFFREMENWALLKLNILSSTRPILILHLCQNL